MLIALIIYFILDSSDGCDDIEMSSMINKTFESIMTSVLIVATIWVIFQCTLSIKIASSKTGRRLPHFNH